MLNTKKTLALLLLNLSFALAGSAQNTINNYKYVLVPERFSFLKQNDQYTLNTVTKTLLEDKGFKVYFDNADLPSEIATNRCTALNADLLSKNSMFATKLTLVLKDCKGNVVFQGKEGVSREKEYNLSYNMALQEAFNSFKEVPYAYNSPSAAVPSPVASIVPAPVVRAAPAVIAEALPAAGTVYAQPTATGYQLIDTTPKIILSLFKTSVAEYFIASNGTVNGLVFKKDADWVFEYYKDTKLVSEKLLIKF
ncbi:hypothetical protein LPB86_14460 [Pedobacter sp. MC2016-14]|uniref:hypothetical protein n=1 Tax=Pedobacter sp. MC2016-14 TaxID=2897327 RepID=UPI001E4AC603|nr:hypothetical protein [Pedobacter sp. MC2016-14]MCD0489442.1 hypothetical protein [Pedobacter sp. MC2016-14]